MHLTNTHILLTSMAALKLFVIPGLRLPLWELLKGSDKKQFEDFFKTLDKEKNVDEFKKTMSWLVFDDFNSNKLNKINSIAPLIKELEILKEQFYSFYISAINGPLSEEYLHVYDVHARIIQFKLQIDRLRMIINPEIQLALNVHTYTKIEYIAAKGMWLDNDGVKVRKFTKSLGKLSNYHKGKNDPKAYSLAEENIRDLMLEEYRNQYRQ